MSGPPPTGPIKLVILPRTRRGLDRAGLRRHLETVHGPMVVAHPEVSGGFLTYVHHYACDGAVSPVLEGRDAVTIIRFGAVADMIASKASAGYRETVGPDEANFSESQGTAAMFAEERDVFGAADDAPRKLLLFRADPAGDLASRAAALAPLATFRGVRGIITNVGVPVEGAFEHLHFDEIGIDEDTDIAALAIALNAIESAAATATDPRFLLVDTVRFI